MKKSTNSSDCPIRLFVPVLTLACMLILPPDSRSQVSGLSAEDAFKQAIIEEEVHNNPQKALQTYSRIIEEYDMQRTMAAAALYRLAECHRKLGDQKSAIDAFSKLVQQFPEQSNYIELANQNLTALTGNIPRDTTIISDLPPSLRTDLTTLIKEEISALDELKKHVQVFANAGRVNPGELLDIEKTLLLAKQKIQELQNARSLPGSLRQLADPEPVSDVAQRGEILRLLNEELALLKKREATMTVHLEVGNIPITDVMKQKVEILQMQQKIAIYSKYAIHSGASPENTQTVQESEELRRFRKFIQDSPDRLSSPGPNGLTLLHEAILTEDADAVSLVLAAGVDPNAKAQKNYDQFINPTPLALAIKFGNKKIVESLLDKGADPNGLISFSGDIIRFSPSFTPLYYAYSLSYAEIVSLLEDRNGHWVSEGTYYSPYHLAIIMNDQIAVDRMIMDQVPVDLEGGYLNLKSLQLSPFPEFPIAVAWCRNSDIAGTLIEAGADPILRYKVSPLFYAIKSGDLESVKKLIEIGYDINGFSQIDDTLKFFKEDQNPYPTYRIMKKAEETRNDYFPRAPNYPVEVGEITALAHAFEVLSQPGVEYAPVNEVLDLLILHGGEIRNGKEIMIIYHGLIWKRFLGDKNMDASNLDDVIKKLLKQNFNPSFFDGGKLNNLGSIHTELSEYITYQMALVDGINSIKSSDCNIVETIVESDKTKAENVNQADYKIFRDYLRPQQSRMDGLAYMYDMLWKSIQSTRSMDVKLQSYSLIFLGEEVLYDQARPGERILPGIVDPGMHLLVKYVEGEQGLGDEHLNWVKDVYQSAARNATVTFGNKQIKCQVVYDPEGYLSEAQVIEILKSESRSKPEPTVTVEQFYLRDVLYAVIDQLGLNTDRVNMKNVELVTRVAGLNEEVRQTFDLSEHGDKETPWLGRKITIKVPKL